MAKRKKVQATEQVAGNPNRKMEILGIIILAIAILIGISIITYQGTDYGLLSSLSVSELFKDQGPALRIKNGLGPLGAYIAHALVYLGLGYPSLVLAIMMGIAGWYVFRHKDLKELAWGSSYAALCTVLLAVVVGWFHYIMEWQTVVWNGSIGLGIATILRLITGVYGSAVLLFALVIIAFLVGIDGDIQVTIDRFTGKWKAKVKQVAEKRNQSNELDSESIASTKSEESITPNSDDTSSELQGSDPGVNPTVQTKLRPDDVLKRSIEEDEMRQRQAEQEKEEDLVKNRAILDKPKKEQEKATSQPDEPDMEVFVGDEEEEAKSGELEKLNKRQGKELPEIKYKFPTLDLLDIPKADDNEINFEEINAKKKIILEKLNLYGIEITAINAIVGPTVTLYELTPAPDVKISKIESYANDLKMAMEAHGLRIIAPIPGKAAVGIEVPNDHRKMVSIRSMINSKKFVETDFNLPVAFGKTIENENFMIDLTKMPHLLVAGATGSGKSVGINTIITCLLYKCHPEKLKFVLVDPKKIELSLYRTIEKHFLATLPHMDEPIITDTSQVLEVLNSVCKEMDDRYDLLKMAMVRDIAAYNEKFSKGELDAELGHRHLPYIVVIIDELADLMMTAGKQVEEPIARLAQLARAIGIHLVVATQRPSVNVITGTIKANFPARVAYQVASKVDSRTILDSMGADQLVGRGDMLFSGGGPLIRVQNAFVSTEEVERITAFIGNQLGYQKPYYLPVLQEEGGSEAGILSKEERDELFEDAARTVVLHQQGSVSLLQRKLKLGYNRAGRLIDQLFAAGVVGPYQGSTARDVLVQDEDELEDLLRELDA